MPSRYIDCGHLWMGLASSQVVPVDFGSPTKEGRLSVLSGSVSVSFHRVIWLSNLLNLEHSSDDPKVGEMSRLVVSPAHRRRGIGAMLIDTAVDHARANGLEVVQLMTSDLHRAALAAYGKKGWKEERRVRYGTTWVRVLQKKIA
jgi:ribosomal protein S18 acetylase RimI-like enzyme